MSYRRVWLLVHALNTDWNEPVVETQVGGPKGTKVTDFGRDRLSRYRTMEAAMLAAARGPALEWISESLRMPD